MQPTHFDLTFEFEPHEEARAVQSQWAALKLVSDRWRAAIQTLLVFAGCYGVTYLLDEGGFLAPGAWSFVAIPLALAYAAGHLTAIVRVRRVQSASLKRQRGVPAAIAPRRHVIDATGVRITSPVFETTWQWSAIIAAEQRDGFVHLVTVVDRVITLPVRAFATSEEAAALLAYAQVRIGERSASPRVASAGTGGSP